MGSPPVRTVGRYALHDELAAAGTARVFLGQLIGSIGFSRVVAIKQLHPTLARTPELSAIFVEEARQVARIRHPNIIPILDVIADPGELFVVMDYVHGESLSTLLRAVVGLGERVPLRVAVAIVAGVLHGLHAAHEASGDLGKRLDIVHRDVSPDNVIVGVDGVARVLDFGVAKARERMATPDGPKRYSYLAPEQFENAPASRLSDIYGASIVLWETLAGRRLFSEEQMIEWRLVDKIPRPSEVYPGLPPRLDDIVLKALSQKPADRFPDAQSFALALEQSIAPATPAQVGAWVAKRAAGALAYRNERIQAIESSGGAPPEREALVEVSRDPPPPVSSGSPPVSRRSGPTIEDIDARCERRVGTTVSEKWKLERLLGVGGMAAVYHASHRNGTQRALKILHPEFAAHSDLRARFLREAYITNKVGHAGVVAVLDDGVDDAGAPYLVMQLLAGETLNDRANRLEGKRMPLGAVLILSSMALSILEAAHAQGIVHRDVKPENLFWTAERELKLLDFGIARVREQARVTRTGLPMGTPGFMAPEQALGRWDEIDARTDVWAVGATMFTLLSGTSVHTSTNASERVIDTATRPVRSLGAVLPSLPLSVVKAVDRALAFEPSQRFPDARTMRLELEGVIGALRAAGHSGDAQGPAAEPAHDSKVAPRDGPPSEQRGDRKANSLVAEATAEEVAAMKELFPLLEKAIVGRIQYGPAHKEAARRMDLAFRQAKLALAAASDGRLYWNVGPYAFLVGKDVLWEPKPPLEQIPYRLFADGVRVLGISRGISEEELSELLRILTSDPANDVAPGDDLVTMIWEAQFQHIVHEEVDAFAEGDQDARVQFERDRGAILALATMDTSDQLEDCWRAAREAGAPAGGPGDTMEAKQAELTSSALGAVAQAAAMQRVQSTAPRPDALVVDEATLAVMAAMLEEDVVPTGERFVDAAASAYVFATRHQNASSAALPLRVAIDGLAGASAAADAVEFVCVLCNAVEAMANPRDGRAMSAALAEAILSPQTLELVLAAATTGPDPLPFASSLAAILERLGGAHFDAVIAAVTPMEPGPVRDVLVSYVSRLGRGHEAKIGSIVARVDVDFALALLHLLIDMGTPAARAAAANAAQSPHPVVRIEALAHIEGLASDRLRLEVRALLEDTEPDVRVATLRTIATYSVRAAGPSIALRIRSAAFDGLPLEERRQALATVNVLMPSRAEAIAIELLADSRLVPSDAHEQTRELAAELLANRGSTSEARDALEAAARGRWRNSERVRDSATKALQSFEQRSAPPPRLDVLAPPTSTKPPALPSRPPPQPGKPPTLPTKPPTLPTKPPTSPRKT